MTPKEYLKQWYRLDNMIGSDLEELTRLRSLSVSLSSPALGSEPNPTRSTEAGFVRSILKITELEDKIGAELDKMALLKEQIRNTIDTVTNRDERMVLRYRYIHNMTWYQIADEMTADESTVRRWHSMALQHIRLPKNIIKI